MVTSWFLVKVILGSYVSCYLCLFYSFLLLLLTAMFCACWALLCRGRRRKQKTKIIEEIESNTIATSTSSTTGESAFKRLHFLPRLVPGALSTSSNKTRTFSGSNKSSFQFVARCMFFSSDFCNLNSTVIFNVCC